MSRRKCSTQPQFLASALLLAILLSSCSLPFSSEVQQGNGYPALSRLSWGSGEFSEASWSPNGQWVVVLAEQSNGSENWQVASPFGSYRHSLDSWNCGFGLDDYYYWLPNNELSCISLQGTFLIAPYPFTSPARLMLSAPLRPDAGGVWSEDGTFLLLTSLFDPRDPTHTVLLEDNLYYVQPNGTVNTSPIIVGCRRPAWVPHQLTLSYIDGVDLVTAPVTVKNGDLEVGASSILIKNIVADISADADVSSYAWDPSGNWIAVRYVNYQSGDKIYLVNAHNPQQTVDVVHADLAGQQMTDPMWSPDGKTLIAFGVNDGQPYAIAIADYLHSKGLQP